MATAEVARLALRAGFVFVGVVQRTGASTVDLVQATNQTAVVRVDEVLRAPADFGERKGTEVTVRLAAAGRKGQRAVFFTIGWISGTGLAVQEIGRLPAKGVDTIRTQMDDAVQNQQIAELRKRVAAAAAIVVGKVRAIGPVQERDPAPSSEHDPQWRAAVVAVELVEKGQVKQGEQLRIAFASSRDVMWVRAPKPVPGDSAVFLAQRHELKELGVTALAIVEPLDMRPVAELDQIRSAKGRR